MKAKVIKRQLTETTKKLNEVTLDSSRVNNQMKDELAKLHKTMLWYKTNLVDFCSNALRIVSAAGEVEPFNPYIRQRELLEAMATGENVICKHTRCAGITTAVHSYLLWRAVLHGNQTIVVMSDSVSRTNHDCRSAVELYSRCHEEITSFVKIDRTASNTIKFSNGSRILFVAANPHHLRGMNVDVLYIDNMAFIGKSKQLELKKAFAPDGYTPRIKQTILTSIPNMFDDTFAAIWKSNPSNKPNSFRRVTTYWWDVPTRDEQFEQLNKRALGDLSFAQQYQGVFITK